jgi:hypothetical protein
MGIDITLNGRVRLASATKTAKPRKVLQQAADVMRAHFSRGPDPVEVGDVPGGHGFSFEAHPAAQSIEVFADDSGRFRLDARTTVVGPGYHAAVCELADELAKKLNIEWAARGTASDGAAEDAAVKPGCWDDTGYFFTRDFAALERSFDDYTRNVCNVLLKTEADGLADEPGGTRAWRFAVGVPVSPRYLYEADVLTPMGPRDMAWARAAAADPSSPAARSIFAWWHRKEDAGYHLASALVQMWKWAVPNGSDMHAMGVVFAFDDLLVAYDLDPALDYPWADIREMCELIDEMNEDGLPEVALELFDIATEKSDGRPGTIGYCRAKVAHDLPGEWRIILPGRFGVEMEEAGTWIAFDSTTTVRVSSMRIGKGEERPSAAELIETFEKPEDAQDAPMQTWAEGETLGRGYFFSESDKEGKYTTLMAAVAERGEFAFVTISFDQPEDKEVVMEIWKSIRPQAE